MADRKRDKDAARHDVAVFHPGVQHSWQTALALQQLDRLSFYATSIFYQPDRWPYRLERYLPPALAHRASTEFRRFAGPPLDPARVETAGAVEWLERVARRAGWNTLATRLDRLGNRRFAGVVTRLAADRDPAVLWGYNGSSLESFRDPRLAGRLKVLDRTIGDWRQYNEQMAQVRAEFPAFFEEGAHPAIPDADIARDDAEYEASDLILTGSPFAADTVARHASDPGVAAKLRVLPYGFDEALFGALPPPRPAAPDRPVRFLFIGQAGPRKGIHLLLEAAMRIPPSAATVTILGALQVPRATFARYAARVTHRPTVPRADVPAIMAAHDVLVFPSYFEGSALSLIEALAAGMALIQSPNAGLGVTPHTGLLLPELSVDAVYGGMMTMIEDRGRLAGFRAAAQAEAAHYRFGAYRDRIADLLANVA